MRIFHGLALSLMAVSCAANPPSGNGSAAQADSKITECAPAGNVAVRTTMYFGLSQPKGVVTEQEWQAFLRDQVTARFPQGLTVWEADGQWRLPDGTVNRERAKVLLLIHDGKPPALTSLGEIVGDYRKKSIRNRCFGRARRSARHFEFSLTIPRRCGIVRESTFRIIKTIVRSAASAVAIPNWETRP